MEPPLKYQPDLFAVLTYGYDAARIAELRAARIV